MEKNQKIRQIVVLSFLIFNCFIYSQIGLNNPFPRGALDINNNEGNNTMGLVLPIVKDTAIVVNPVGEQIALGTLVYDQSENCIRYYLERNNSGMWSDCVDGRPTSDFPFNIDIATIGDFSISSDTHHCFRSQILNPTNYGIKGKYNGVLYFNIHEIGTDLLDLLTAKDLYLRYPVLNLSRIEINEQQAKKIKDYVNLGGILWCYLSDGVYSHKNLNTAFGGKDFNPGTITTNNFRLLTSSLPNILRNGLFGNLGTIDRVMGSSYGQTSILTADLPQGLVLAQQGGRAGIWIPSNVGRGFAVFFWDEGVFRYRCSQTPTKQNINTAQDIFLHNLFVYALNKGKL